MLYENIKQESNLDVSTACSLLKVSRNWYAAWLKNPVQNKIQNNTLYKQICVIKKEARRYGYRRITKTLHRKGIKVNHKKVLKIMHLQGILCKKQAFKIRTTNSNHNLHIYSNLIRNLKVVKLNQVWVSDITYIHFANNETAYLATVMDRFSRKCIGWSLSYDINTQLCLNALNMALEDRKTVNLKGLIHHSDQGSQYASNEYTGLLEEQGILISMSRKGNCYDNAHAESLFKTIKYEEVYMDEYHSFSHAYNNIKHFIEEVYNKKRLHSSIGYMPPTEFEKQYKLKEVLA